MRDSPIDGLIRKSLSAGVRKTPDSCVNENLMAAYLESSLTQQETAEFESHVANCAACQEILAISMKLRSQEQESLPEPATTRRRTLLRLSIPIPALLGLLLVCIAIAAVLSRLQNKSNESAVKDQVAELRPTVQQPVGQLAQPRENNVQSALQPDAAKELTKTGRIDAAPEKKRAFERKPAMPAAVRDEPAIVSQATNPAPLPASPPVGSISQVNAESKNKAEGDAAANAPKEAIAGAQLSPDSSVPAAIPNDSAAISPVAAYLAPQTAGSQMGVMPAPNNVSRSKQNVEGEPDSILTESKDTITPARTQEPFARPHVYAASNRIATTLYTTGTTESSLRAAIKSLGSNLKAAESKKIGDRTFYKNMGYWIDRQCTEHVENQIVEIDSVNPEYASIKAKYPDIRSVLPAVIHWKDKNYLLR